MNAAVPNFQFTGSRQDCHHSTRSDSTFQASYIDAKGSIQSRSGGALSSRLIHTHPPQSSHLTETSCRSSTDMFSSAKASGRNTKVLRPSIPQHQPWNGDRKSVV